MRIGRPRPPLFSQVERFFRPLSPRHSSQRGLLRRPLRFSLHGFPGRAVVKTLPPMLAQQRATGLNALPVHKQKVFGRAAATLAP